MSPALYDACQLKSSHFPFKKNHTKPTTQIMKEEGIFLSSEHKLNVPFSSFFPQFIAILHYEAQLFKLYWWISRISGLLLSVVIESIAIFIFSVGVDEVQDCFLCQNSLISAPIYQHEEYNTITTWILVLWKRHFGAQIPQNV